MARGKDWSKSVDKVLALVDREVRPVLEAECRAVLARFPKASYVAVRDGMGRSWIEIDGIHYHCDEDQRTGELRYHAVGLKADKCHDNIKAWRLDSLARAMLAIGDGLLDQFRLSFPDVEVRRDATSRTGTRARR